MALELIGNLMSLVAYLRRFMCCRGTPVALYIFSFLLIAGGAAVVYLTPDDTAAEISIQAVVAALALAGGGAAFSGASLLNTLQK